MHNQDMKAFVINLESRRDRWDSVLEQSKFLNMEIVRVIASDKKDIGDEKFVSSGVAAAWKSHQSAISKFLETGDDFGLILEDDFLIMKKWSEFSIGEFNNLNLDFLQVGFLITTPLDFVEFQLKQVADTFLKFLLKISNFDFLGKFRLKERLLIKEQEGVPWSLVCNDIRPGAHAYIISRKFACAALNINNPIVLSTDALYMALGWMRAFNFFRVRKSLFAQSDSVSSIGSRFTRTEDV